MKLFVDSADLNELQQAAALGIVAGVTTNPTLLAKSAGGQPVKDIIQHISQLFPGKSVSMECVGETAEAMVAEGKEFITWSPHVTVKIPFGIEGIKATAQLSALGIATNVTLVFSANQALLAANAGATFISSFVGRLDDVGHDGLQTIQEVAELMATHNYASQVLAASIRHPLHVQQAAQAGAHIATIPLKVLLAMYQHPLTAQGLAQFTADWQALQKML